jgi:hypothetical protein
MVASCCNDGNEGAYFTVIIQCTLYCIIKLCKKIRRIYSFAEMVVFLTSYEGRRKLSNEHIHTLLGIEVNDKCLIEKY